MKLAVLFSGGKDSCLCVEIAQAYGHEVAYLLTVISENNASYMFHTPNITKTELQSEAMNIPLLTINTQGEKENELDDLQALIKKAKEQGVEGIVSGALASSYQSLRIQRICKDLDLWCFNPLWQRDEYTHSKELIEKGYEIYFSSVAAYPLDKSWLGRKLDINTLNELQELSISPSGEGGEFETFVASAPSWKKRIVIEDSERSFSEGAGLWNITQASLQEKEKEQIQKPFIEDESQNILLISTCQESLSELEFVLPIKKVVGGTIVHYTEVLEEDINRAQRIIICGTALQDMEYLDHPEKFSWLKSCQKPILGICAGAQTLAKHLGIPLEKDCEIELKRQNLKTPLGDVQEMYLVHQVSTKDYAFKKDNFIGLLFHPEVRNEVLLENFKKL